MGNQPLVVAGDLLAQIFGLRFQERFRIPLLHTGDEETEETAEQVADPIQLPHPFSIPATDKLCQKRA